MTCFDWRSVDRVAPAFRLSAWFLSATRTLRFINFFSKVIGNHWKSLEMVVFAAGWPSARTLTCSGPPMDGGCVAYAGPAAAHPTATNASMFLFAYYRVPRCPFGLTLTRFDWRSVDRVAPDFQPSAWFLSAARTLRFVNFFKSDWN